MLDNTTTADKIKLLDWISAHKQTFAFLVLLFIIGYLYLDNRKCQQEAQKQVNHYQEVIVSMQEKALQSERERASRLEFLLEHLPKDEKAQ